MYKENIMKQDNIYNLLQRSLEVGVGGAGGGVMVVGMGGGARVRRGLHYTVVLENNSEFN